jgi:hypothetical protein
MESIYEEAVTPFVLAGFASLVPPNAAFLPAA